MTGQLFFLHQVNTYDWPPKDRQGLIKPCQAQTTSIHLVEVLQSSDDRRNRGNLQNKHLDPETLLTIFNFGIKSLFEVFQVILGGEAVVQEIGIVFCQHLGLQVWCRRHDGNVAHIDFEGNTLQTDFRCLVVN